MNPIGDKQTGTSDDLLNQLVEELVDRVNAGETIDREAYRARMPENADLLDDTYDAVIAVLGLREAATHSAPTTHWSNANSLSGITLGGYRLLREIGRGGMGIVFEAEHVASSQRVAMKVLSASSLLSGTHLERFQSESRAATMLRHPHVVRIHSTGFEQGLHYYVMELMEGGTLADLIDELREDGQSDAGDVEPQPVPDGPFAPWKNLYTASRAEYYRATSQLSLQIAEALHDAHQHGVIHRDIKPSNILLSSDGTARLGDFGMAHILGDPSLTQTGDRLGTLRYMSPEQAQGNSIIDHRTDIYSLGATMYELLALRPAIDTVDHASLLLNVIQKEPPHLKRLAQNIPHDLTRIVHQAMAKCPAERYDSAGALAADLERFLQGKPVLARRPHTIRHVRRWMVQHWSLTMLAAFSTILMLLLSTVGPIAAWRYHQLAESEAAARHSSEEARRQLQTLIKDSLIDATEALENTPGIDAIHRDLVDSIQHQVEGLLEREDLDQRSRIEAADVLVRLAYIHKLRFGGSQMKQMVQRAVDMLTPMASKGCSDADLYRVLCDGWFLLAQVKEPIESMRRSVRFADMAVQLAPTNQKNLTSQAWSQHYLGESLVHEREFEEAEKQIAAGTETFRRLQNSYPENGEYSAGVANGILFLSTLHEESGRLETSFKYMEQFLKLLQPLEKYAQNNTRKRAGVAGGYVDCARLHYLHRRFTESRFALEQAERWVAPLETGFPNCRWAKNVQRQLLHQLGDTLIAQEQTSDAIEAYCRSVSLAEQLEMKEPSEAKTHWRLALAYWKSGNVTKFRAAVEQAIEVAKRARRHDVLASIYLECPDPMYRDAAQGLESAQIAARENTDLRYLIALAHIRGRRMNDAARYLQNLQKTQGHLSAAENVCLARSLMELGDLSQATSTLRRGLGMIQNPCRVEPDRIDALADELKSFSNLEKCVSPMAQSCE